MTKPPTNLDELRHTQLAALSVQTAAEIMGVDFRTLFRAIAEGDFPCVRIGRRRLVPTEPLRQLLGIPSEVPAGD